MKKIFKKSVGFLFAFSLIFLSFIMGMDCATTTALAAENKAPKATVSRLTLYVGYKAYQIKFYHLSNNATVLFKSNNEKVVIVSKKGIITPNAKGSAVITVSMKQNKKTYTSKIKVTVKKRNFSADKDKVECYDPTTINITSEYHNDGYIHYNVGNPDIVNCEWGEWNGDKIPLTIKPMNAGTTTITITTDGCPDKIVINVTALETAQEITVNADHVECHDWTTINITDKNSKDSTYYKIGDTSVIDCDWGEWDGYTIPLTIKPKKIGATTITITSDKAPNSIVIQVNIVEVPKKEISTATNNIVCEGQTTVYITDLNAGDEMYYVNANTNIVSCEWGEWKDKSTATLIITPLKSGATTVTIKSDRASNELVLNVTSQK